jgi:hypothetical protein
LRLARDGGNESVSATRHRLDVLGEFGRIAKGFTQAINSAIQPVLEINKSPVLPQLLLKLIPGHEFARTYKQYCKHLKRLIVQVYMDTVFPQLAGGEIHLEVRELQSFP